jgi:hypothetical protein
MKYITYLTNFENKKILDIGGLGHSLCDYLTPYIISKIDPSFLFLNNKLEVSLQKRNMNVKNNEKYFWNDYLNLNKLNNIIYDKTNEEYKKINLTKTYSNIELDSLQKMNNDNTIYFFSNNNRLYLFDLYQYELLGLVEKNITKNIINNLRNIFYEKHTKLIKNKYLINIYIRRGDLYENLKNKNKQKNFELHIFDYIYNKIKNNLIDYTINIISAGTNEQMNNLKKYFENYNNINLLFNQKEEDVFYLMTQSDLLVFNETSFPFTSSLYCNGLIIKNKNDNYFQNVIKFKNIKFLDNYYFIDNIKELELLKININNIG